MFAVSLEGEGQVSLELIPELRHTLERLRARSFTEHAKYISIAQRVQKLKLRPSAKHGTQHAAAHSRRSSAIHAGRTFCDPSAAHEVKRDVLHL